MIIFDCDGVLVDSERVANEVFARILDEVCGLQFSLPEMFDTFVGQSRLQCLQIVENLTGKPAPAELDRRYREDINQALEQTVQAIDGIEPLLDSLSLPYCVASSGSHEKMQMTLGKTGLIRFFDNNIFSTSEVERGKPHPDIYLHAAKRMGFDDPARCVVVEDSPVGVQGAVAAGMRVLGYAELMPAERLRDAGAHQVFHSMHDLPSLVD